MRVILFIYDLMIYWSDNNGKQQTSYKEVKIGGTLYRVTSVFTGEKNLAETLERLAVRKVMAIAAAGENVP